MDLEVQSKWNEPLIESPRSPPNQGKTRSQHTIAAVLSVFSACTALCCGSAGSFASFGSICSAFSIVSANSLLSIASVNSVLSVGCSGGFMCVAGGGSGSAVAGLHDVNATKWLSECVPPYVSPKAVWSDPLNPKELNSWSNYYQLSQTSGLCADALACAFSKCQWTAGVTKVVTTVDLVDTSFESVASQLPPLNLPAQISFPESVKDLVTVVQYANKNNKGLSVKTSGHSYHGAHTAQGSVQLNLRGFPKYSSKSVTRCDSGAASSASAAACQLALARNKSAVVRVGGGEVFDDVYRAVIDWNSQHGAPVDRLYEVIGGGAGTVSAAGGWLQGGGLSTGLERLWGYGVDQVLELEMVLADGIHIKFGPTQWQYVEGFDYPQTTQVNGKCNTNVDEDESLWIWDECSSDVPFNDLWFSVRGGGGGTYGVVTALHYQLHELWNLQMVSVSSAESAALGGVMASWDGATLTAFENMWYDFFIDFLWVPSNLGIDEAMSNGCGSAAVTLSLYRFSGLWCKEGPAQALISAWRDFVVNNLTKTILVLASNTSVLQAALSVTENWGSYAQQMILSNLQTSPAGSTPRVPAGHVPDWPSVTTVSDTAGSWSAPIPIKWLAKKDASVHLFCKYFLNSAHLMGGRAAVAQDGTTAVPSSVRHAAVQGGVGNNTVITWLRNEIRPYLDSSDGNYPPDTEYNHISPDVYGPLKSDWSVSCPKTMTEEEQDTHCVSVQESVWGADTLSRLEDIKQKVDPKGLMNCYRCVGYQVSSAR